MKPCHSLVFAVIFLSSLVALPQGQPGPKSAVDASAAEELKEGIIVEEVAKNSEAEKAGLREDDIILRWARGDATGKVDSPFDLAWIEIEQAPRGSVALEGVRGTAKQTWTLGPGGWGAKARPDLPPSLLSAYREGQGLAKQGKLDEAAERWRAVAGRVRGTNSSLSAWLLFHAAELLADAQHWKDMDENYQEAIQRATDAGPVITAQLLRVWASTYETRNDWVRAERYYQQSITESQRLGIEGLAIAASLDDLGIVFRQRGDLAKAEDFCQSALNIRTKLAPGSLAVARSFNNLGSIAWSRGDLEKAEAYYQQALDIRQKLAPASLDIAASLHSLGTVVAIRGDLGKADQYLRQALNIRLELAPASLDLASSFNRLGLVAQKRGDLARAEELDLQALDIRQKLAPGSLDLAATLNNLGIVFMEHGNLATAEGYYRQALDIRRKLAPGSLDVATSFNNLGLVAMARGDLARADDYLHQGLDIRQKFAPASLDAAASLNNLGVVAEDRGDLVKAEGYFRQAVDIKKKLAAGSLDVASALNNLGDVAQQRGNLTTAEKYHRQALDIRQKLAPGSLDVATSFSSLGDIAREQGDLAKAEEWYLQALDIKQKVAPGRLDLDIELGNLGVIAMRRGDLAKAEEYFRRETGIAEKLAPHSLEMASGLQHFGDLSRMHNDPVNAEDYYHRALIIREELAPGSREHAESLASLAAIMWQKQQLDVAAKLFERALDALENQVSRLGGADEVHSNFRAKHRDYYNDYIDLLLAEKQPELAFQVVERSHARSLLEMLAEARVDIRKGVDPALLERERSLQESLAAKSNGRIKLLSDKHTNEQAAAIDKEIEDLLAQHKDVEEQIRLRSPSYAALTQPKPLSTQEVQQLLDADTLLLEYALGEQRSYVFAVTSNSLVAYELPKRVEIEAVARRLYGHLATWEGAGGGGGVVPGKTASIRRLALSRASAKLSGMILGPLAERLSGKRLLIVGDGALHYIPFAVLPVHDAGSTGSAALPLIAEHEIVSLPSASVLAVLRQEALGRKVAPKAVAVLADPVFDKKDERVGARADAGRRRSQEKSATEKDKADASETLLTQRRLSRALIDVASGTGGQRYLRRLPFSREEAQAILSVTPAGQGMQALDFDANRATATSPELAQYRLVHFATHGLLDSEHPELSGLVLSLVDERGIPQSGFLALQDIYNLNLPADLVVLSACATGLGKEIKGEGLMGLTRGFMYAGATRVVASLWDIDDAATAELMKHFYQAMEKEGMRPAAALRQAQIRMWKQKRWADAYYWAGFQMQGEWR